MQARGFATTLLVGMVSHKAGYAAILLKGGRAKLMSVKAQPTDMAKYGSILSVGGIASFSFLEAIPTARGPTTPVGASSQLIFEYKD